MGNRVEVEFGVKNAALKSGLAEARAIISRFKADTTGALTGAFAAGSVAAVIKSVIEYADRINDLAERFGVSTTVLQQWGEAAERAGTSAEAVAAALNKVMIAQSEAAGGNGGLRDSFAALGVDLEEVRSLGPDQLLVEIGKGSMDAAPLVKVLGKNATELIPLLKSLSDASTEFGSAMSNHTVKALGDVNDQMAKLRHEATVVGGTVLVGIANAYKSIAAAGKGQFPRAFSGLVAGKDAIGSLLTGDIAGAKSDVTDYFKAFVESWKKAKSEIGDIWNPPEAAAAPTSKSGTNDEPEQSVDSIEREITLREKLDDIRRRAAFEAADDHQKLEQLIDREHELRLRSAELERDSEEGLTARIEIEEAALEVVKQRAAIAEKELQVQKKAQAEREAQAERFDRETESARSRLGEEQDRLAVMEAQARTGATSADRLERQLSTERQLAELETRILKAREEGNTALAETLQRTKAVIAEQAKQQKIEDQTRDKLMGADARRERTRQEARERRAKGSIESRDRESERAKAANEINSPDVFDGPDPRARFDRDFVGPKLPPGGVVKPANNEKNEAVAKLVNIESVLVEIRNKVTPPLG